MLWINYHSIEKTKIYLMCVSECILLIRSQENGKIFLQSKITRHARIKLWKKDEEFELPLATLTVDASASRRRHVDAVFCVDVVDFFPSTPTPNMYKQCSPCSHRQIRKKKLNLPGSCDDTAHFLIAEERFILLSCFDFVEACRSRQMAPNFYFISDQLLPPDKE